MAALFDELVGVVFGVVFWVVRLSAAALGAALAVAWLVLVWSARHPALAVLVAVVSLVGVVVL